MNRFVFTDASVKELARCVKHLYDTFTSANKTIMENPTRSINSDFHLDYALTPWNYYYYMDADAQISILRQKYNGKYYFTLEMYGINTDLPHCELISDSLELKKHCYGKFDDIDTVISVFKSIIVRINSKYTGDEYTKLTQFYRDIRIQKNKELNK